MFGLIPKDEKFFAMFKEMTVTIIEGANLLKDMMDNFENPLDSQKRIKDVEHKCDQLTHDIIQRSERWRISAKENQIRQFARR